MSEAVRCCSCRVWCPTTRALQYPPSGSIRDEHLPPAMALGRTLTQRWGSNSLGTIQGRPSLAVRLSSEGATALFPPNSSCAMGPTGVFPKDGALNLASIRHWTAQPGCWKLCLVIPGLGSRRVTPCELGKLTRNLNPTAVINGDNELGLSSTFLTRFHRLPLQYSGSLP